MTPKKDDSPEVYKQEQFCFNNSGITQRRTGIHLYDRHLHNDFIKKNVISSRIVYSTNQKKNAPRLNIPSVIIQSFL